MNVPRPRDLAVLLLASGDLSPRQRARDQQADRAGLDLKRRMLNHVAAADPEPEELEVVLAEFIERLGPPSGPARALAVEFREEWQATSAAPEWTAHLLHERSARPSPNARTVSVSDTSSRNPAPALLELQKLAQKRPALTQACEVLSKVLPAIFSDIPAEKPLDVQPEKAHEKLRGGVPLLRGEPFTIDESALERRWTAICTALHQEHADVLAAAVTQRKLRPRALVESVLTDGPSALISATEALGLDPSLAATVLRMAALPALAQITRSLAALLQTATWDAGYCPGCGSWPLLGEARGLEQERFLRCGLCASAWPCGRLFCPYCGNRDYQTLGYLHVEGEEDRYRAGTCDQCQGYVKWVSTIFTLAEPQLLVADLATMHLDLAAAERGFFVP